MAIYVQSIKSLILYEHISCHAILKISTLSVDVPATKGMCI